jgi:hypothetical protein
MSKKIQDPFEIALIVSEMASLQFDRLEAWIEMCGDGNIPAFYRQTDEIRVTHEILRFMDLYAQMMNIPRV